MYEYFVKDIIKVVDGDTVDILIDLGFNIFTKQRIRLSNIDTPEIFTKNLQEKEQGLKAKNFVIEFFNKSKNEGHNITLMTTVDDKYGRMLGTIFSNGQCLNDLLITNKLAVSYN